jgi:CheY-like chemotaxis protein
LAATGSAGRVGFFLLPGVASLRFAGAGERCGLGDEDWAAVGAGLFLAGTLAEDWALRFIGSWSPGGLSDADLGRFSSSSPTAQRQIEQKKLVRFPASGSHLRMSPGTPESSTTVAKPATILVVEDEPMVGEVVCAMLQMGGLASTLAKGPDEALEILKDEQRQFALLLTDFRMPRMTGIELIQHAQSIRPGLKSILYSGNADESVAKGHKVRPDRFLPKPFTPKVLNNLVLEVLAE